jgi:hypothetical protein
MANVLSKVAKAKYMKRGEGGQVYRRWPSPRFARAIHTRRPPPRKAETPASPPPSRSSARLPTSTYCKRKFTTTSILPG